MDAQQPWPRSTIEAVDPTGSGDDINREIARKVARCYAHYVGREPRRAEAFYQGDVVVVVMRSVMTDGERVIRDTGGERVALAFRQALNGGMRGLLTACVEEVVGSQVVALMTSTDVDADSASCVFVFDRAVAATSPAA